MKYSVFDSGKLANRKSYPSLKGCGWDNSSFVSKEEAIQYAKYWLGDYSLAIPPNWDGSVLDYGQGCTIEIREE